MKTETNDRVAEPPGEYVTGRSVEERVSALEAISEHLATKTDVEGLKV